MSEPLPFAPSARLNRTQLSAPASSMRFLERAAASDADVVFLDLEDSVAPPDKVQARRNAAQAIDALDWGRKILSLRVNAWDTVWTWRDVVDVLSACGERLDLILLPKCSRPAEVHALDLLVGQVEADLGRRKRLGLELLIETAEGLRNVDAIAAASPRTEALHYGPGDYAASVGARTTAIGELDPRYPGDLWHYPLSRILVAARSRGLRALDGPYANHKDPEGLEVAAARTAAMGFDGKWAIHPGQIDIINAAFSPRPEEVETARRIRSAMAEAEADGRGAAVLDGKMIDIASLRQAHSLLRKAEAIEARAAR